MIDINMDIASVNIKQIGNEFHIELQGMNTSKVTIITDRSGAELLQGATEKAVVDECYQYEEMQKENDRLNERVNELEELLDNLNYQEAI